MVLLTATSVMFIPLIMDGTSWQTLPGIAGKHRSTIQITARKQDPSLYVHQMRCYFLHTEDFGLPELAVYKVIDSLLSEKE